MLNAASFRRHLASRLAAVAIPTVLLTSGCYTTSVGTGSFGWPEELACPPPEEAGFYIQGYADDGSCGTHLVDIDGPGTRNEEGSCEYPVTTEYHSCSGNHGFGRPYRAEDHVLTAPPVRSPAWLSTGVLPDAAALSDEERHERAARFRRQALLEHASIASFARASLALMAAGAPADLVAETHRAALDEVEHARLCFALASAYAGTPEGPGQFPVAGGLAIDGDLVRLAVDTVRDGCIEETLSTIEAAEALVEAANPAERAVLEQIVTDEARHAELAWRTAAWALSAGGADVRDAVLAVLVDAQRRAASEGRGRAFAEVVLPAARALLAQRPDVAAAA